MDLEPNSRNSVNQLPLGEDHDRTYITKTSTHKDWGSYVLKDVMKYFWGSLSQSKPSGNLNCVEQGVPHQRNRAKHWANVRLRKNRGLHMQKVGVLQPTNTKLPKQMNKNQSIVPLWDHWLPRCIDIGSFGWMKELQREHLHMMPPAIGCINGKVPWSALWGKSKVAHCKPNRSCVHTEDYR